jgi:hypothetical protein
MTTMDGILDVLVGEYDTMFCLKPDDGSEQVILWVPNAKLAKIVGKGNKAKGK